MRRLIRQPKSTLGGAFQAANLDGGVSVDQRDLAIALQNLGVSTRLRPLFATLTLDPTQEALAPNRMVTSAVGHFAGTATPGSRVRVLNASGRPLGVLGLLGAPPVRSIVVGPDGRFSFDAPLHVGANLVQVESTDSFGQRELVSTSVLRVASDAAKRVTPLA
jgi:hypothetical protein